ncbi:hypothetical protein AYR62_14765 [Secundilactobacillus paracollinoides]|uniref:Uncharacterized protein n=1 Tax=Secundilactobacillus paracollinoides TaxID=240427 RepID=A0A1B2IXF2_9LACO|nr:hypothetical protein [Secundilactobacillus paracollinoides]ANZ65216.1 hypothetical protein AYR62_14765 [Secundilactobacillus paracollinoides]ANZ66688.1 hypothetical protein AYR63_05755 [Secundilactobacillus paracollinoides]
MSQSFTGNYETDRFTIQLDDAMGEIVLGNGDAQPIDGSVNLFFKKGQLVGVSELAKNRKYDRLASITPGPDVPYQYLARMIADDAIQAGIKLTGEATTTKVPTNQVKPTRAYLDDLLPVLTFMGLSLANAPVTKKGGKPRHSWRQEIATMPFTVDHEGAKATVYWTKRNALVIKAGAQMKAEAPLNKDGSLGFSARFTQQLRDENKASFDQNFVTTTDVQLKSVNEVGLFLYFGGTNSWLQLINADGESIGDLTVA